MRRFHFVQKAVEALEAGLPESTIILEPLAGFRQRFGFQAARAALRILPARYQAGALQHLEVSGDRRLAHREWLGKFYH